MALHAFGREQELKDLEASGAEGTRATQQVEPPHPDELLPVAKAEFLTEFHEVRFPRAERGHIVLAEVVQILGDEHSLRGLEHLRGGGEHGIREDVF